MKTRAITSILLALVCICCGLQTPAFSAASYALDLQNPTSPPFNTNNPVNAIRGWRFRADAADILVTELGVNSPLSASASQTVTLFDFASQAILGEVTTTAGPGWRFVELDSPVALTQGSDYIVAAHFPAPGGYYFGSRAEVGNSWFPTGEIQYIDMRFANDVGPSTFPTDVLFDQQYGIPDIGYQIGDFVVIPAPAAVPLVALGATALPWLRRRRML